MNIVEAKAALASRAEEVAQMLLPGSKTAHKELKAAGIGGGIGTSLSVALRGSKAGLWADFATGEGGDLVDLWRITRNLTTAQALDEIRQYLGAPRRPQMESVRREYVRPPRPRGAHRPADEVMDWLRQRGLTQQTIEAYRVAADGEWVLLPYLRDGELVNIKRRSVRDKKKMRQEKDAEPCLFGWDLIDANAREITITEGEFDAMALHQVGIAAVSVNAGAGNHQWIESDWERLERFETIYLAYDSDEAGQKGAAEVARRLGMERCRIVTFPGVKDANDYLLTGAVTQDYTRAYHAAKTMDPEELVGVAGLIDDVALMFDPDYSQVDVSPPLVLGKAEEWFRFRAGEVTTWTGYNGHGKSMILGQVQLALMEYGEKFCVFSGELPPKRLLYRLARQGVGMSNPTDAFVRSVLHWMVGRCWIFNVVGSANSERMLEVFVYAARRYGVTHCVIDSLMMLEDVPEDGKGALEKQRLFMAKCAALAKRHGLHIHVVAHPRKGQDESGAPGKQDVSGSGKISNLADNVISVWARLRDENDPVKLDAEGREMCDCKVEVMKQRNGDAQHRSVWGWYSRDAYQMCRSPERHARRVQA